MTLKTGKMIKTNTKFSKNEEMQCRTLELVHITRKGKKGPALEVIKNGKGSIGGGKS